MKLSGIGLIIGWLAVGLTVLSAADGTASIGQIAPDFSAWKPANAAWIGQKDDVVQMTLGGVQPMLRMPPVKLDASQIKRITFQLKLPANPGASGRILFITETQPTWSDSLSVSFPCFQDGQMHDYTVDLGGHPEWKGVVTGLRLDPVWASRYPAMAPNEKYFELGGDLTPKQREPYRWQWAVAGLPESFTPAAIPLAYEENDWRKTALANNLQNRKTDARLVMLGDSLTHMWLGTDDRWPHGGDIYQEFIEPLGTFNFALAGDTTRHTLYQLADAKILDGMNPKVITLMIGVNNLLQGGSPADVAEGVRSILTLIRHQCPNAKILLMALLPSGLYADTPAKIAETNRLIAPLADGEQIIFLDMTEAFSDGKGALKPELTYDKLHLNSDGYILWEETMRPRLHQLLELQ